jgi:hypothetical protein
VQLVVPARDGPRCRDAAILHLVLGRPRRAVATIARTGARGDSPGTVMGPLRGPFTRHRAQCRGLSNLHSS